MIGRLYYDNDKKIALETKLQKYIDLTKQKTNMPPDIIEINKQVYNSADVNWYIFELRGTKVRPSEIVMPNYFFVGWEEDD